MWDFYYYYSNILLLKFFDLFPWDLFVGPTIIKSELFLLNPKLFFCFGELSDFFFIIVFGVTCYSE